MAKCTLSNKELIEKSNELVHQLAKTGGQSWSLSVPVNFNRDPDMIFCEIANRLQQVEDYAEPNYSSVEMLTALQAELGYVPGEISTVAILGLVGEAGEVLDEVNFMTTSPLISADLSDAINICGNLDRHKKNLRKGLLNIEIGLDKDQEINFDKELADTLYYLNILATNRGLTVFDLAQMAHDKVRAKQAAGGSSEDPKIK